MCAEENGIILAKETPEKHDLILCFHSQTWGWQRKWFCLVLLIPSESLAFKEHFRILSSNTNFFFLVSVWKLWKTNLCNWYAHLSYIFLKYFLNTFDVWIKITQTWGSVRFQRTGVCDELLLAEMLKEKLSSCLFQLLQADTEQPAKCRCWANIASEILTHLGEIEGHKRRTWAFTTENPRK